jgi:hypothetical protein
MIILDRIRNEIGDVYAQLSYEPTKNYLLMKWMGYCTEEQVKFASMQMLKWQQNDGKRKKCHFHVHDTKELESAWVGLVDWINNEFFALNHEAGLRYNISILSPDLFSKLSSLELHRRGNIRVPTILFETFSDAENWITRKYLEL